MQPGRSKTLAVTVDFNDNIAGHEPSPKRMYTPGEVEHMLDYFQGLGVRRLYWFHNAHNGIYKVPFGGAANLLAFAVEQAHQRGMTVLSVIKPFETGTMPSMPAHLEPPAVHTRTVQGTHVFASEFACEHPEMRLKFRPRADARAARGGVNRVELVNNDEGGASLRHDELELRWSAINGQFQRYDGPMQCEQHVEEGSDGRRRVLTRRDLALPTEARFVLVLYRGAAGAGDFGNAPQALLRLWDDDGQLPSQADRGRLRAKPEILLTWGLDLPAATRAVLEDPQRCAAAFEHYFHFENHLRPMPPRVINEAGGAICHTLDFNEYCSGALHPAYPQVRQNWLERVAASLDTGVDGVALRVANHSSHCSRPEALGFNEPALREYARRTGGKADAATADFEMMRLVNGDFYTQFLRDASAMIRQRGKRVEHFVHPLMDRLQPNLINTIPEAFQFNYRQWLREGLLDGLCLRPYSAPSFEVQRRFADMAGAQAKLFGVSMFYANPNGMLNRACVDQHYHEEIDSELQRVSMSELFDGCILYEAAGIIGFDEQGGWHSCTQLENTLRKWWPTS